MIKIERIEQVEAQELFLDTIAHQEIVKRIEVQPRAAASLIEVRLLRDIAEHAVAHQEHLPTEVLEVEQVAALTGVGHEAHQAEAVEVIALQAAPLEVQAAIEVQAVLHVLILEVDHLLADDHPQEAVDHQAGAQEEVAADNRPQKFHKRLI